MRAFGLYSSGMAVERIATTLGIQSAPYALLPHGIQFVEYIMGAAADGA